MGDGLVLESGTHNDLIQGGGAYARLVQAQKLHGGRENTARVDSDDVSDILSRKKLPKRFPLVARIRAIR